MKSISKDRGDTALVCEGITALRAWFFTTVKRANDPTDVIGEFPKFPVVEMINEMDAPPEGFGEAPPGAMSIFDFYKSFVNDADTRVDKRGALAVRARECLHLSPEFKTTPHVNVGVRFLFHLSHALKTLTPPGPARVDDDPQMVVDMPLDCSHLLHMIPPHMYDDPTKTHEAMWADPEHVYEYSTEWFFDSIDRNFNLTSAMARAFPDALTLGVRCVACKCDSSVVCRGDAIAATETQIAYIQKMVKFFCPQCGFGMSCLNPNVELLYSGVKRA